MRKYFLPFVLLAFWSCEEEVLPIDCAGVEGGANICGCIDSNATNYDSNATFDDGSCEYDITIRFNDLTNLFKNQCYSCHSAEGFSFYGLNLDSYQSTMDGSVYGPVAIPFQPYESLLYLKCSGEFLNNPDLDNGGVRMPEDNRSFFDENPEKLNLIYNWIADGCLE